MNFHSTSFENDGPIPAIHTGEGADLSPRLVWDSVPTAARSLALICDDPDSSSGEFAHWVLYDIPPTTRELPEGASGIGLEGLNDFGVPGYRGPMPPEGEEHRYAFTLHALDRRLDLEPGATKDDLLKAMDGHVLMSEDIIGTFARSHDIVPRV
jgi:Raf kinase inhibitor-like YbhB/YbcL family protein